MLKKLGRSEAVRRIAGEVLALYLRLVYWTNRLTREPADMFDAIRPDLPVIVAMWHGQHFMLPYARPPGVDARVMVSRSGDGDINAIAAARLGMGLIRASGGQTEAQVKKRGGVRGFLEVVRALKHGATVVVSADVPKGPARVAGEGIVMLAEISGRPILPMAFATSRRLTLNSWDKATVNLPFGRSALVWGDLIPPPKGADERPAARKAVEAALDAVTRRAHDIVDRRHE